MFARVTLLEIDLMRIDMDAALAMYQREVLPEMRQRPGYEGALVLTTPDGKGAVVSFWHTAEEADASAGSRFYSDVLERYAAIFRSPAGRERYEVALAEIPAALTTGGAHE